MMDKIITHFNGTVRAAPYYVNIMSILIGIIFRQPVALFYGLFSYFGDICNHFLKIFFKNVVYKNTDYLPILGYGKRPDGAKYCGIFIDENNLKGLSTSFGMPSGHSHFATLTAMFWSLYLIKEYNLNLYTYISIGLICIMSLSVMISRYYLGCHTPQQIIFGGLLGLVTGYLGYYLYEYVNDYIKKNI